MFFIRHSRLFNRRGLEEQTILRPKRSEGRLKRFESCTDTRAWSLDRRERSSYILDFMTSIARSEDTPNKERALEITSSQGQSREIALEGTFSQRQVLPSGYEKEYISDAIEHAGVLHGESDGVDLQSGNLPLKHIRQESENDFPDDISESSLGGGKFIQIGALQPNTDGGYGCSTRKESTSSKENIVNGEHSGVSLQHAGFQAEKKSDDAVHSDDFFEDETIRGEDETLPLDQIIRETLVENILNDISEYSLPGGKFTQVAALQPNPDGGCGCSTKKELISSKENTFYSEQNGATLQHADVNVEKKSDDAVQSNNLYEDETIIREDENLPLDHIKQESLEESILNDVSESFLHGEKFAQIAALKPNPDGGCGCNTKKELLTSSKENTFYGKQNGASLRHAGIKVEKKSDTAVRPKNLFEDETIRGEEETLLLDHIKQESLEESTLNDISEFSLHGGKFKRFAALRPNPARNCVCSAAKELLTSSKVNNFYTLSLQPATIKLEKKSDELLSSTKGNNFYAVSLQPAYIKVEEKSDKLFHTENLVRKKSGTEDETKLPFDHVKQELVAKSILDDVYKSSLHGDKFTQIKQESVAQSIVADIFKSSLHGEQLTQTAALKPNPELMKMVHEYVCDVARESASLKKEDIGSYKHVQSNEEKTYSGQLTSTEGLKKHEEVLSLKGERDPFRKQMDLKSATCSCKVVKEDLFVPEAEMDYHNFLSGSLSTSSRYSVNKEVNPDSEENPSVQYVSYSRSPTITISEAEITKKDEVWKNFHGEQRDPQTAPCSCNSTKKPGHMLKTVNVPGPVVNMMEGTVRETKGYDNSNINSSQYNENGISFDSDIDFCKQRFHACREAKQISTASNETAEISDGGMAFYLIPVPQAQRTERSFSEKEEKCYDSAKEAGYVANKEGSTVDDHAFEAMGFASHEIKKEEEISLPYGEVNGTDGGNRYILMDASQYAEENVSYETESSFDKQHMCACKEAKKTGSASQEEAEIPACGRVYFLIPGSQVQGTEFDVPGKEGNNYGDKVSSETPVTDVIHFNENLESRDSSNMNSSQYAEDDISFDSESDCCRRRFHACREAPITDMQFDELDESHDRNGNIQTEMSEKLVRSFDVERKFYKEQMDTAIRKLNDQIKEIENLRAERNSLKTNLDTAQHYIEQHKQAINKLNNMRKVDEQLSRENELLLKKIYQLSHTAFNQQTKISKLKTKLKQKSKHNSYIQNSGSSGKGSGEFKPVHVLYPTSQNNMRMPYKSVLLESYSQYPLTDSESDAASRYNNMAGNDRYSFNHINAKSAFVERTVNHVQITAITDHTPQTKKYLDLKKTIRREKDDLLKVTKLIQFQQGVISNLSNCIDNERMLLSELNSARMGKK